MKKPRQKVPMGPTIFRSPNSPSEKLLTEDMDENICRWMLEFLLRQPVDDGIIKLALSNLPLPPDCALPPDLKKSILIRTVKSALGDGSISETLLEHLETLEAIDIELGKPPSASMKDAYCTVALECTLRYLHGGVEGKARYSAAVQRIWRERVQAVGSKSQLISAGLLRWRARLETALSDKTECEKLMKIDTRADAFRSIRAYLDESYVKLGPSFLEIAAVPAAARHPDSTVPSREMAAGAPAPATAAAAGESSQALEVLDSTKAAAEPFASTSCDADQSIASKSKERLKMVVPYKAKQVPLHRRTGGGIKITDAGESGGTLHSSYDSLPSPLVHKVQEALKSSSLELQAAVRDPLPDSMRVAASLVPDVADIAPNLEPLPQNHVRKDVHVPGPSLDKNTTEAALSMLGGYQAHKDILPRHSLMERNSTAQTYQWDDSPEGISEQKDQPQLRSPKRLVLSPLRIVKPQKVSKRRPRMVWSLKEEETLRDGVNRLGQGNWKLILNSYRDIFKGRTEVDLKDKWRNMNMMR